MNKPIYHLFNPIEGDSNRAMFLVNRTQETKHPIEPAIFIQLQAEALFGVRLTASRISEILVQFYGYDKAVNAAGVERIDVKQARDDVDTDTCYGNASFERDGLFAAIRQSIPGDVVTVSEYLAEAS